MAPRYTLAPAPRLSGFIAWDCTRCGHEELGKAVWLRADGGQAAPYGRGCAAVLLYGERSPANVRRARAAQWEADARHRNALDDARRVAALPPMVAGASPEVSAAWHGMRALYHHGGGFAVLGGFFAWCEARQAKARALLAEG